MFFSKKPKQPEVNIGDLVVCINDTRWEDKHDSIELRYGEIYKVWQLWRCSECGKEPLYDIGCRLIGSSHSYSHQCNKHTPETSIPAKNIHWAAAKRFVLATQEDINRRFERVKIDPLPTWSVLRKKTKPVDELLDIELKKIEDELS